MFKSISATNFLSWKQLEFNIESGITLITGYNHDDGNSEGSGKSAILNALSWAIYGKLPKDANIDDVITTGSKDCCVVVTLENGTEIVRARKPNELAIQLPNGDDYSAGDVVQGKDAKETQRMIEDTVGMSFETFCQSVYFAQNYPKKFITATEEEKTKILSELQDLTQFDKAGKVAHERMRGLQTKAQEKLTELRLLLQKAEIFTNNYDNLSRMKSNFDLAKAKTILDLERVREFELEKIAKLQSDKAAVDIQSLHDAMTQRIELRAQLNNTITELRVAAAMADENKIKKEQLKEQLLDRKEDCGVKKFSLDVSRTKKACWLCDSVVSDETHQRLVGGLEQQIAEAEAEMEDIKLRIAELENNNLGETTAAQLKQAKDSIIILDNADLKTKDKITYLMNIDQQLESFHKSIDFLDGKIAQEKAKDSNDIDNAISECVSTLDVVKATANEVNAELETLKVNIARYDLLKDGFKEVKSFVFQSLLNELNFKANQYLRELFDQNVRIEFKNITEANVVSKIVATATIDGVSRPLGLYSGGQFARLQWAVNLALSDIVAARSNSPINVRIFDEHFKDLSEPSMDKIIKLLGNFKGSTILIEHNSMVKNIVNRTFEVEYRNGQSNVKS